MTVDDVSAALTACNEFPAIRQEAFKEDCLQAVSLIRAIKKALVAVETIPSSLDDAIVSVVGDKFTAFAKSIGEHTSIPVPADDDAAAEVIATCLEVCAVLLQKQWTNGEGVLQQINILMGEGHPLDGFFRTKGYPETATFCGRKFSIWPRELDRQQAFELQGLSCINRRVRVVELNQGKLTRGEEATVVSYDPETFSLGLKYVNSDEQIKLDARTGGMEFVDLPIDSLSETSTKTSYVRILLPPCAGEAMGRYVVAKITLETKSRMTLITEEGELLEFDIQNLASTIVSIRYLNPTRELETILNQSVKANHTILGRKQEQQDVVESEEWTMTSRPIARLDHDKSIYKFLAVERFAKADGIMSAIRLIWKLNVELGTVCLLLEKSAEVMNNEKRMGLADKFTSAVLWKQFTEQELKSVSLTELDRSLENSFRVNLLALSSSKNAGYIYRYRLQIWFQLVCSSSLPQRLLGMTRFSSLVVGSASPISASPPMSPKSSLDSTLGNNNASSSSRGLVVPGMDMTTVTLQYITQERVVERIFGENRHLELVNRSVPMLHFLARKRADEGGLNQSQLDSIWIAAMREEGETMRAIHSTIVELVPAMVDSELEKWLLQTKLKDELKSQASTSLDERMLEFVHELTRATFGEYTKEDHPGLVLLMDFVFGTTKGTTGSTSASSIRLAIRLLGDLFGLTVPKRRLAALDQCVKIVGQNDAEKVPQSLLLIQAIVDSFPSGEGDEGSDSNSSSMVQLPRSKSIFGGFMSARPDTRKSVISALESKAKILKTVVGGMEKFYAESHKSNNPTTTTTRVFDFDEQASIRLDFLSFALRCGSGALKFTEKLTEVVWNMCVVNAPSDSARTIGLKWFGQSHTGNPFFVSGLGISASEANNFSPLCTIFCAAESGITTSTSTKPALGDDSELWVLSKGFPSLPQSCFVNRLAVFVFVDYFLSCNRKQKMLKVASVGDQDGPQGVASATVDDDTRVKRAVRSVERIGIDLVGYEQAWKMCLNGAASSTNPRMSQQQQASQDEEYVFDLLCSFLCRVTLSITLKDAKKVVDIRSQFLNRCIQGISGGAGSGTANANATSSSRSRRKHVRLLRTFLLKATQSPSETCRVLLLPPLPGTPGSLSRRDELPRSRTGPVMVKVSLGSTLGELRKNIVPKALAYTGTETLGLRIVQKLNLDSMASANVKWTFLPHGAMANGTTLRDLGFERLVVLQVYEGGTRGGEEEMDSTSILGGEEEDTVDETIVGDAEDAGDDIEQYSDATYAKLFASAAPSMDTEIENMCGISYDADPQSWPVPSSLSSSGAISRTVSTLGNILPPSNSSVKQSSEAADLPSFSELDSNILRPHALLGENLLTVLGKLNTNSSKSRRDLADLWDCYLALPPDPTLTSSIQDKSDLSSLLPSSEPFRILAVLRALLMNSPEQLQRLKGTKIPSQVLNLIKDLKSVLQTKRTCAVLFLACSKVLEMADVKDRTQCAKSCLDWAMDTNSLYILQKCLELVERCLEKCDDLLLIRDKLERLWTERLLASSSSTSSARFLISASLYRCAQQRPAELNVFSSFVSSALEEFFVVSRGEKGTEFDSSTPQGQRHRRKMARSCEPAMLLFARMAETCAFEKVESSSSQTPGKDLFFRTVDTLMAHVPMGTEEDKLFCGLTRLARGLLMRKDLDKTETAVLEKQIALLHFLGPACFTSDGTTIKGSSLEACLGLLSELLLGAHASAPRLRNEFLSFFGAETLLLPSCLKSSSANQGQSKGLRRSVDMSPRRQSLMARGRNHASPSLYSQKWNLDIAKWSSAARKYHFQFAGIGNLGATCYQNSLLQQLFHVTGFSSKLLEYSAQQQQQLDEVLSSVQMMFASMFVSSEVAIETKPFCSVMRDYDGSPISTMEQKDVQEFSDLLFTRLEAASPNIKSLLEFNFGGTYLQRTQSLDPAKPYVNDRQDPFYLVQVDIKGKQTLREALDGLVSKTRLVGENKCELPNGEKVDATVQTLFSRLPPHLMIHLKRFEFHYATMTKAKVDDYLSFPLELDMRPYMAPNTAMTKDDYMYELNGILVHSGGADSGHYYSFIRERVARDAKIGRQWYEFNDQLVWPYAEDRIARDCFGGFDRISRPGQPGQFIDIPRSQSAYILVYDRISVVRRWETDLILPMMLMSNTANGNGGGLLNHNNEYEDDANDEDESGGKQQHANGAFQTADMEEEEEEEGGDGNSGFEDDEDPAQRGSKHLSRQGRPFGSFVVPATLLVKVQNASALAANQHSNGSTSGSSTSPSAAGTGELSSFDNDRVVFHPLLGRILFDLLQTEAAAGTAASLQTENNLELPKWKELFRAMDAALVYVIQVLSHSATINRRRVVDDWISLLEKQCRAFPQLAQRVLERVCIRSEVFLKPLFVECPSRIFRKRFAELLLLCAEACLAQDSQLDVMIPMDASLILPSSKGKEASAPLIYAAQQSVPRNRFVWLLDALLVIAESCTTSMAALPSAEFFALMKELVQLDPQGVKSAVLATKKTMVPNTFLDLMTRKGIRFASSSKSSALNLFSNKRLGFSQPSALAELVLELASDGESSGKDDNSQLPNKKLPATFGDRYIEAAMKLRDFTSAVRGIALFFPQPSAAVEKLVDRVVQSQVRLADDFVLVSDCFRFLPQVHDEAPQVVDALVESISKALAEEQTLPAEDLLVCLRCLGTIAATCKQAQDHLKTHHKKALAGWPKDIPAAFKAQIKRTESTFGSVMMSSQSVQRVD